MIQKSVKLISNVLKNKQIDTVYFTGFVNFLDVYIPCKFIMDREVTDSVAEIIEINELLSRKPNRLNENSIVVLAYDEDVTPHDELRGY